MFIESDTGAPQFNADEQIQPSSIDLRLSNVFWQPIKSRPVDLRKRYLMELEPRRFWKKLILSSNEMITLKPGQLILCRTCEKFSIPKGHAGRIEGRSSFARMGIMIHCTGGYINPGYRGQMPLEIVNFSPNSIRIFPYLPICQLVLVKLSETSQREYGVAELGSKYMDDDGGPSYWWRDKYISKLQETFKSKDISLKIQDEIMRKMGIQEVEVLERLEQEVERFPDKYKDNAESLLEFFSEKEDALRRKNKLITGISMAAFPILASVVLGTVFASTSPWSPTLYGLFAVALLLLIPFLDALQSPERSYFGKKELKAHVSQGHQI